MDKITIRVEGMSCQHCLKAVEGALTALEGVSEARVSLQEGNVAVSYDSARVSPAEMKAAIEGQGYDVP